MPSTRPTTRLYEWVTSQRNQTISVAIVIAVPTAYAFQTTVGSDGLSGDFLLLMTLAVFVPTAYDEYWPKYDRTSTAIAWIIAACAVATAEFTTLYLIGIEVLSVSPLLAGIGAFLITDVGSLAWLAHRHRSRGS